MNPSIKPGMEPPRPGLEREEPELAQEDDIPKDEAPAGAGESEPSAADKDRPLRQVERE